MSQTDHTRADENYRNGKIRHYFRSLLAKVPAMLSMRLPSIAVWLIRCLVGSALATGLYLGDAGAILVSMVGLLVTWATFERGL